MAEPTFARIEIALAAKTDLVTAAAELRMLANDLDVLSAEPHHDDASAIILARHRIKRVSQTLRGTKE